MVFSVADYKQDQVRTSKTDNQQGDLNLAKKYLKKKKIIVTHH